MEISLIDPISSFEQQTARVCPFCPVFWRSSRDVDQVRPKLHNIHVISASKRFIRGKVFHHASMPVRAHPHV
eukprot:scaffold479872_cov19-Prasinocladus_malaysianus.AAC.1